MNLRALVMLFGVATIVAAVTYGRVGAGDQTAKPLETVLGYYLEGAAAWRQDNPEYVQGGEAPRFWIREYRWGPGHDLLTADAYAVFDGERCEPVMHFVHIWDANEQRVANQAFGPGGLHLQGSSQRATPNTLVTEVEGQLPNGSSMRMRDVTDLSNPYQSVSVGHRWDGDAWVAGDTARWDRAPARVCG